MKLALIESMTKTGCSGYIIRVWREEPKLKDNYDNYDIHIILVKKQPDTPTRIVEVLKSLDRINAIEVLDKDGNGVVAYTKWP